MGPVLTKLKNWLRPDKAPEPPVPQPAPAPTPAPVEPIVPDVKPSAINAVNYLRALMILRNVDFKKLKTEFFKLPLKKLAISAAVIIWCGLSYFLFRLVTGGITLK